MATPSTAPQNSFFRIALVSQKYGIAISQRSVDTIGAVYLSSDQIFIYDIMIYDIYDIYDIYILFYII